LAALVLRHCPYVQHVLPDLTNENAYSKATSALLRQFLPSSDDKLEGLFNQIN